MERNNIRLDPLKHFIKENGYVQLIKTNTRLNRNGGSCLDWIITDSAYVNECGILHDLLSDHFPIFCVRKKKPENVKREWKIIRIYINYDKDVFANLLRQSDWGDFDIEENPNVLWDIISQKIENILAVMCPYKKVCVKNRKNALNHSRDCMLHGVYAIIYAFLILSGGTSFMHVYKSKVIVELIL